MSTRETYDSIGPRFLENARDRSAIRPWLDRFAGRLSPGARVLDLGAGPGVDSAELRLRGLRAISLDLSMGMLRTGVAEFPGPRVQADARHLPLRRASVAGVWASASLLHVPQPEIQGTLEEICRVLRSPGLLFVSVKQGAGAAWESDRYGKPRFFQYWSGDALDAALEAAGFRIHEASAAEAPRNTWLTRLALLTHLP